MSTKDLWQEGKEAVETHWNATKIVLHVGAKSQSEKEICRKQDFIQGVNDK